jgi:flagellar basal body-associated protein FliL
MNEIPEDFQSNSLADLNKNQLKASELEDFSSPSLDRTQNTLKRILLVLLGIGLVMGALLSVGVVMVMNKLGMNEVPKMKMLDRHEIPQQKESTPEKSQKSNPKNYPQI